ncbi:MAG TPA: peptidylprolyl isomerase [Rhizomicrobium sp.]|nr:peptidylprolyl isomerase [Rhizomicrobium sp.]
MAATGALALLAGPLHAAAPKHAKPSQQVAKTEPAAATAPTPDQPPPDEAEPPEDFDTNGVAAVINDQIVSEYDLTQRVALVISTSGMKQTAENRKKMRPQVLEQLKTEKLELIEAQRKNITVSPTEVDKEIEGILTDNKLTLDQLKQILGRSSVAMETLRAQIAVQIAWQKAIEDEYGDRINITQQDVDDELARAKEGADKPHYLVAEIFLAVESPDQDEKVHKSADDLVAQMKSGAPFPTIARQFSQSPSAAEGGDLGWVHDGQLAPELNDELRKTTPGQITPPIRSAGGYYILFLRQRQEGEGTKVAAPAPPPPQPEAPEPPKHPGYLPLARFLLPVPAKAPKDYVDKAVSIATQIRQQNPTCAMLQKVAGDIKGSVYMSLGEMKLTDLGEAIQAELAKVPSGEATPPFRSAAGIEIIARCDKQAPRQAVVEAIAPYKTPTRDEVERRLFQKQISMLARRYIRDLRREANVETR